MTTPDGLSDRGSDGGPDGRPDSGHAPVPHQRGDADVSEVSDVSDVSDVSGVGGPVPRCPTTARVWGQRALLGLPMLLAVVKLVGLRGAPVSGSAWVTVALGVTALTVTAARAWRAAPRPRLSYEQALDIQRDLPRARRRVLHRALRRRGPLPPELRADATRYLWASRTGVSTWFVLAVCGANVIPDASLLDDDVLALVLALGLTAATAGHTVLDRHLVRRAHHLGLPLNGTGSGIGERGRG